MGMRRRPAPPVAARSPAADPVDPWVGLLAPSPSSAPSPSPLPAVAPPTEREALAVARADAARRIAAGLLDRRGRPVRVVATVARGDDLEVVLSAAASPPRGWSALGDGRLLVPAAVATAALLAAVPDELADPAPALLELDGVAVDIVAAGVVTLTDAAATVATVRHLLAGLLGAPAALGVDVLVSGLDPRCLPRLAPDSPGRLHAPIDAAALVPLALALAGTEEPVVVVAPAAALGTGDRAALAAVGVGAIVIGGDTPDGGWCVTCGPDGRARLAVGADPAVSVDPAVSGGGAPPPRAAP